MSVAIEMEPSISLDRMPPDIIRRIIRFGSDSVTDMRLISRTWNTLATKYLSDNPKLPAPLERVYLSRGKPEDVYKGRPKGVGRMRGKDIFHMYSVLPEQYSKRIGVGGWLKMHKNHGSDTMEVARKLDYFCMFDLRPYSQLTVIYRIVFAGLALALIDCAFDLPDKSAIVMLAVLPIMTILMTVCYWKIQKEAAATRSKSGRLARLFSSFTHIETLVLDNFRFAENNLKSRRALRIVQKALKDVRIDRLEIREHYLNIRLQKEIIELCRAHKIQHVIITVQDIDLTTKPGFFKFVIELATIGITLDVYERNGMNDAHYFTQTKTWWDQNKAYRHRQQVSISMATIHDASFDKTAYQFGVKSHFRFEKRNDQVVLPTLKPAARTRGFNHRWI